MSSKEKMITLTATCLICKKKHYIAVPESGYIAWQNGARIQDALPTLSANERELFLSNMCGACFDKLFD